MLKAGLARVGLPHVLIDQLGWLTGRGDPARLGYQFRHDRQYSAARVYVINGGREEGNPMAPRVNSDLLLVGSLPAHS